ncbi:hypothetical protein AM588_10007682 [Phytophthora nicotianae]|uniref:Uncharacterized protein n=1 Tax=Phytophthora nicotianae TaxID=4792 RepID=A0A0W8D8Q5_PHYNI|nr:hypothetical protein AM588_10007682 [Phytophthora nicotianae]
MELLRCLVCSMDMAPWSLADRETHLNACLDAASTEQRYECPTCSQDLSSCDERQRTEHVNRCLDRAETVSGGAKDKRQEAAEVAEVGKSISVEEETELLQTQVAELTQVEMAEEAEDYDSESESECGYVCKICGFDMSEIDLMRRIRHVKLCGQKFGVRPQDMGEVEQAETIVRRLEKKEEPPDVVAIMMKSSAGKEETSVAAIERSNVFDVLMRGSKTAAVLNSRKRPVPFKFTRKAIQRRRLLYPDFKCIQGTDPPFIVDGFQQEKVLYLFGSYTIGKERLFMEIARKFQKKVCVSKAKLKIIETFGWPSEEIQLLTTEPAATKYDV